MPTLSHCSKNLTAAAPAYQTSRFTPNRLVCTVHGRVDLRWEPGPWRSVKIDAARIHLLLEDCTSQAVTHSRTVVVRLYGFMAVPAAHARTDILLLVN
jgi:hypothetical protein